MRDRNDDLVELAQFRHGINAHSIRILLEANGIPAVVDGDAMIEPGLEMAKVYVHRKNLELAKRVVHEVPPASEVLIPEWLCQCGEQVDSGFCVCWHCGTDYESGSSQIETGN